MYEYKEYPGGDPQDEIWERGLAEVGARFRLKDDIHLINECNPPGVSPAITLAEHNDVPHPLKVML